MYIRDQVTLTRGHWGLSLADFVKCINTSNNRFFGFDNGRKKVPPELLQRLVSDGGVSAECVLTDKIRILDIFQNIRSRRKTGAKCD